jgi:hypothetical protein
VLVDEPACDREELLGRVVREDDLSREAGPQTRIRGQETLHQAWVPGRDHDQALSQILHSLQQRLHRLGPEVEPLVLRGERVRLVDEQNAVDGPPDNAVGLERRGAHPLTDEARPVDLDEVAAAQQPHRAVHLSQQSRHRRLPGAGIAEKHEMLARRDFGEAPLLAQRLNLQERHERPHLLLHGLEPHERVQFGLQLVESLSFLRSASALGLEALQLIGEPFSLRAGALAEPVAQHAQRAAGLVERISWHGGTVPVSVRVERLV